jgi:outer membrane protein OmpA-like peptidoglycan-associated protein
MRAAVLALAALVGSEATAQEAEIRFIACPVFRDVDAGRKSGCWLADDAQSGERYDVGLAPTKPDWNHEVLVEGKLSNKPDVCGGKVLDPVRVSVLSGGCTRHILPAENMQGRAFVLPPRNVRPISEPRKQPEPPFSETTFHLLFDWNRDFLVYQLDDFLFDQAMTFIRGVKPKKIVVTGHAATKPAQVSNRSIAETAAIARRRAETVTEALVRMGVDPKIIETKWKGSAEPVPAAGADGLAEPSRRRVDIKVTPH